MRTGGDHGPGNHLAALPSLRGKPASSPARAPSPLGPAVVAGATDRNGRRRAVSQASPTRRRAPAHRTAALPARRRTAQLGQSRGISPHAQASRSTGATGPSAVAGAWSSKVKWRWPAWRQLRAIARPVASSALAASPQLVDHRGVVRRSLRVCPPRTWRCRARVSIATV